MESRVYLLPVVLCVLFLSCTSTIVQKSDAAPDYGKLFESAYSQLQIRSPEARERKEPLVLVHYMPWFQAPPMDDGYGYHWHEGGGVFDPYETLSDGRAQIASHYYPLTGPYDSRDIRVLEYQAALMKLSGIDGVIFDWYGINDVLDYKVIHESTEVMIGVLKKAGLKYIICYEDQSIERMIEAAAIQKGDALDTGKTTFRWMQENWFSDDAYVKHQGRPVVMCFGPQYYRDKAQWDELFSAADPRPLFISLNHHVEGWADGSYNWMPMELSGGRTLALTKLAGNLNDFYNKQYNKSFLVATAFSGFHDIYRQAGHGFSYGYLDYAEGRTFELTFTAAERAYPDIIQVATWNDYGEGAMIEPTMERGYRELEYLQDNKKKWDDDFSWNYSDLRSPLELYKIIVSEKANPEQKAAAQDGINAALAGDMTRFRTALRASGGTVDFSLKPILRDPASDSGISEGIDVFDSGGRKNLALGKPIIVSSRIYDNAGTRAADGDILSYWEGGANKYPNTLSIDLVSSVQVSTVVMKLNPKKIWAKRSQAIEIQVSDDGTNFTPLIPVREYVFDPVSNGNAAAVSLNVKTRHIRFIFTNNTQAAAGQIAELEIYGEE
ncbi:MAG: discoidin domain-containing protein [Spirochaetaceae bacterium]|nr:discoidin domain-containing protein [Spirochaetaceae bacterium]